MENKALWTKEFVYSQWRKLLCIFVVNRDINHTIDDDNYISNEQLRTVFDSGYKLGLLQTKESLHNQLLKYEEELFAGKTEYKEIIFVLKEKIQEIEGRVKVSYCYEQNLSSNEMTEQAKKRELEFSEYQKRSLSTWLDSKM